MITTPCYTNILKVERLIGLIGTLKLVKTITIVDYNNNIIYDNINYGTLLNYFFKF